MTDIFDSSVAAKENEDEKDKNDPEKHYFVKETLSEFATDVEKKMPLLVKQLIEAAQGAKEREKHIKSISQAKWFIKLKKGVSDTLKAKCLPLNKKTAELIKEHQGSYEIRKKKILECVRSAKNIVEDKKKALEAQKKSQKYIRKATAKDIDGFLEGRDYIKAWAAFESRCLATIKMSVAKEQLAIKILDDYIRDKNTMKELGEEAYKSFKQEQQKLAKSL